ncbi:T9SS type A sorting domain-containing protein [Flavobacterium sp. SUN052]|uniref:beta strand repeat-containing protein n=1 Tax=Flavobacterium sp. SUN052 TaxID=3002441 RepID=UPI00237EE6F3|nr:T9SS type A sorting domain-containing protein [Flavobacterium sp. SUN052]MEC4005485.1 T9SS type A sorting domain-containing protein [Flavobacterium sp. SUN052]
MKKNYLIAILLLIVNLASAQIEPTNYRGAFAPSPTTMWTDSWTNYDPINEPYLDAATVVNVTADITVNTTWTTGKTYKLTGLIYVRNNAILTIQPGVVVKGNFTNTGTALIITKGSKLNAVGTAANPIVFTSGKTVAQGRQAGDWGGIVLLGKAGFNTNNGINNIEGITANVNTEYGGGTAPISNDDSGTLKYVRIEFGGYVFSPNNEINGLTMGAVGSGTTIDYVQVSYANDDAFEWFGGSVNCKHLVSYRNLDDDFDTDNGYKGVVQFGLIIRDPSIADNPSVSTSEGFESDNNPAGTVAAAGYDNTSAIFTNITAIGPAFRATLSPAVAVASGHERALRLRRATQLKVYNSIFMDFKNNFVFVDGTLAVANANGGTLKFKNNIMAGNVGTFTGGVNPTSLNSWFSSNGNTLQASSTGLLISPYGSTNTYSGLDYRPGTLASTGADFTDSSMTPYITIVVGSTPIVTNRTYCKGAIATPLTATLTTTGVSLRWYTVATGGTFSTTAPTPLTTTVGVKNYYVSQLDASSVESARVLLTVTTNALPTEVVGAIAGVGPVGSTSVAAIGPYVGTTSQFVYSVPAFVDTTLSYLWTVPAGVNIVSGQGTNAITVNFANVAFGAGSVGNITIQAVNASGCGTLAKTFALTKALLVAPTAINVYNNNPGYATPATALTTYAKYMGTTTDLTLTATPVVGATAYEWSLPAGVTVSIPSGVTPVATTRTYTAIPFFSPASTPSAIGSKYWVVTYNAYTYNVNGVPTTTTISTCVQRIFGNAAYGGITSAPYLQYGTVVSSDLNSILVNFAGVTNPATTALYIGVRTKNGVGYSVTSNTTNADVVANANSIPGLFDTTYTETTTPPVAPSTNGTSTYTASGFAPKTAKLKKLTAAIPAAPTTLKLTNDVISTTTGVTVVTTYIGTTTPLTLTAAASATASSYSWELPAGVNQISGGNSNVITINFAGVSSGITSLYLGVKAVNGIGSSITSNAALIPTTTSTAKLLKVTAGLPAAPTTLTLTNPAVSATALTNAGLYLGTTTPLTLTAGVSALATSYSWELPSGVTQLTGGNTNVITVNLAGVAPGTVTLYFGVKAVNAVGSSVTSNATAVPATSSTAKLLKITNTAPAAVTTVTGAISAISCGTTYNYTMTPSLLATSYVITAPIGSVVTSASNTTNATNVLSTNDLGFSIVYPSNLATVTPKTVVIASVNGFGTSTTNKTLTIVPATLAALGVATTGGTTFTRCSTKTISFPAIATATNYTWTVADGAVIVSGQGTNSVVVDFAAVPTASTTNLITVFASNNCGVNTLTKTVTLTSAVCAAKIETVETKIATTEEVTAYSNTSVYPNPAVSEFNIDIDASKVADVQMYIYSLNGTMVMNPKTINLDAGRNTINQNVSNLSKGLYIVRLVDSNNKEIMVKKLIKE